MRLVVLFTTHAANYMLAFISEKVYKRKLTTSDRYMVAR